MQKEKNYQENKNVEETTDGVCKHFIVRRIRVDGTRNHDAPFVKWLMKKADLEQEIKVLEDKLTNLKAEIMMCIERLDNEDYKNVLVMHYIKGLPWEVIANRLYVCRATVFNWNNRALELIKIPEQKV